MAADISWVNLDFWVEQISYWRTHLDVFIVDVLKVNLKPIQRVVARRIGNAVDSDIVQNRGFGKTWLIAICVSALCILYPGTKVGVFSRTGKQATLVMRKIEEFFLPIPEFQREVKPNRRGGFITISDDAGYIEFHGGSSITAGAMVSSLGTRYKIIVGDEKPTLNQQQFNDIIGPTRAETRKVCYENNIPDYLSKTINITSACKKNNFFFSDFMVTMNKMIDGDDTYFACAHDYNACVENGIRDMEYFDRERSVIPGPVFAMMYESLFIGEEMGSVFPFNLTDTCRTLTNIELEMPKNSTAEYVIGVDLAVSSHTDGDNAAMVVLKMEPQSDGTIIRKMVYIRTYHGQGFAVLSNELRKLLVKFPRTTKVVFDTGGMGMNFHEYMGQTWVDPISAKEYPPLVLDDDRLAVANGIPILHAVQPSNTLNKDMASALRVALERKTLLLPMDSTVVRQSVENGMNLSEEAETDARFGVKQRNFSMQEEAVFIETDALQVEMGNIISRETESGNTTFGTSTRLEHKDRYSALAMANMYISGIEAEHKRRYSYRSSRPMVGMTFRL